MGSKIGFWERFVVLGIEFMQPGCKTSAFGKDLLDGCLCVLQGVDGNRMARYC